MEEPWMEGASPFVGELAHPRASAHTLEAHLTHKKHPRISKGSAKMSNQNMLPRSCDTVPPS